MATDVAVATTPLELSGTDASAPEVETDKSLVMSIREKVTAFCLKEKLNPEVRAEQRVTPFKRLPRTPCR